MWPPKINISYTTAGFLQVYSIFRGCPERFEDVWDDNAESLHRAEMGTERFGSGLNIGKL